MAAAKAGYASSPPIQLSDLRDVLDSAEAAIEELRGFAQLTTLDVVIELTGPIFVDVTHHKGETYISFRWVP